MTLPEKKNLEQLRKEAGGESTEPAVEFHDFLVSVGDPTILDSTLAQLPAARARLIQDEDERYLKKDNYYVMRVFGDPGFVKFACAQQGYCTIARELTPEEVQHP